MAGAPLKSNSCPSKQALLFQTGLARFALQNFNLEHQALLPFFVLFETSIGPY
jgi:hypothetical protein